MPYRADSRFAPSQWETALLCNDVSYWLPGRKLESPLSNVFAKIGSGNGFASLQWRCMNVISSETFGNSIVCSTAAYKEINKTPQYWPFVMGTTETDGLPSRMPVMRKTSPSCWRHLAITRTNADLLITHKATYLTEFYAKFQFFHSRKNMKKKSSPTSQPFLFRPQYIHCGLVTPCGDTDLGQHWLR